MKKNSDFKYFPSYLFDYSVGIIAIILLRVCCLYLKVLTTSTLTNIKLYYIINVELKKRNSPGST